MKKALIFDNKNNFLQSVISENLDNFVDKQVIIVEELPNLYEVKPCITNGKLDFKKLSEANFSYPPSNHHVFNPLINNWDIDKEGQIAMVKELREKLLKSSDWTQLPDVPLLTKNLWSIYRQQLRDITLQENYPFNVTWPTPP